MAYALGVVGMSPELISQIPHSLFIRCIQEFNDFQLEQAKAALENERFGAFLNARSWGCKVSRPSEIWKFEHDQDEQMVKVAKVKKEERKPLATKPMSDEDWIKTFGR